VTRVYLSTEYRVYQYVCACKITNLGLEDINNTVIRRAQNTIQRRVIATTD